MTDTDDLRSQLERELAEVADQKALLETSTNGAEKP